MFQALIGFASLSHSKSTLSIGTLGVAYELFQWPHWTGRVLWGMSKLREFMCCLGIAWGYGFEGIKTLQPARESFHQLEETLAGQETMEAGRAESKGWRARCTLEI